MRYALILLVTASALALSAAHAQQRGWYWNGSDWQWQGGGPVTRPAPPGPTYDPRSRQSRPRQPDLYEEWWRWGGRPRYCTDQWGNTFICGQ